MANKKYWSGDVFKPYTRGDNDSFIIGISKKDHDNCIELYGENLEEIIHLRDFLVQFLNCPNRN